MHFKFVYKICYKSEWKKSKINGKFYGTKKDKSDGYIHFSNKDQVKTTLVKYFSKEKNLILLKINTLKLNNLIWEQSSDGNLFPHLYSDLELSNVSCEYDIVLNKDGTYRLPLEY